MNDLLNRLGMKEISPFFDECYEKAKKETGCPVWLTENFLREAGEEKPFFDKEMEEKLVAAAVSVKQNADLVLFARTLYHMLVPRIHHESVFGGLEFPTAPEGADTLAYDIFAFYPLLAHVREAYRELASRGADEGVLCATAKDVGESIRLSQRLLGRFGFTKLYFLWCTTHKNAALFQIGRFNFELREAVDLGVFVFRNTKGDVKILMKDGISVHESGLLLGSAGTGKTAAFVTRYFEAEDAYLGNPVTDGGLHVAKEECRLEKSEWTLVYAPGHHLISVHIPADQSFDEETVASSLEMGRSFLEKLYPEKHFSAFMCISWLLSPQLTDVLKPSSNILAFGRLYERFPVVSEGLDIFRFVFRRDVTAVTDEVIAALPENNSLERGLKSLYANGGYLYEYGGLILF